MAPEDPRHIQAIRARVHLVAGTLTTLLLTGAGLQDGLDVADAEHFRIDDRFDHCVYEAGRAGPAWTLAQAAELLKLKRHLFAVTRRFVHDATGIEDWLPFERRAANEIADLRARLDHARELRRAALAA